MLFLRMPIAVLALIVTVSAAPAPAPAAHAADVPRWVQRHFGMADGLPVASAATTAVGADGFLWLATHDGLVRFDGAQFEVFDAMRAPAMSGNRVLDVHVDAAGRLYAITMRNELLRIRSAGIEWLDLDADGLRELLWLDSSSMCASTTTDFYCPDGQGGFALHAPFPENTEVSLAVRGVGDDVWMMTPQFEVWLHRDGVWRSLWKPAQQARGGPPILAVVDADGNLWTTFGHRLMRVTRAGAYRAFAAQSDPNAVARLRRSTNGQVRVGADNGLFVVRGGQPRPLLKQVEVAKDAAYASWRAPDGALWVAHKGQLWRLNSQPETATPLPAPVLVSSGTIASLTFGPDGLIWVSTLRDGIYRLNRARIDVLGPANGVGSNVYSVCRAADGSMWLGTLENGVFAVRPDGTTGNYKFGLSWLVACAPDGAVYAANYGTGLRRLAPGGNHFRPVDLPAALQRQAVRAVRFDSTGSLWIGTTDGAWRQRDGQWHRLWPTVSGRVTVHAITPTDHGVWYATDHGVWYQDGDKAHAVAAELLADTTARDVRFTRDGALWISTVGHGLVRIAADDPMGLDPLQLGRAQGLPSNSPHTIREDADGNIWVNSNQGIFRIAPNNLQELLRGQRHKLSPLMLGRVDGLTLREGNGGVQPAAAWDADGHLWFPSQAGVVRFDPLATHPRGEPPNPLISGIQSEGRAVPMSAEGELPVGVRSLRIAYGAANLSGTGQSRFRYRLLPAAHGWTATTATRSAVYSALPPGHYRFELMAANSDGIWTRKPTALEFDVPGYWYETTTFRLAALAAALLLLALLMRWREHRLQHVAKELNRLVEDRTRELEHANVALQRAAGRDFLTDLPNRRAFVAAMELAVAGDQPLALAILDIDYFKAYNDSLGHVAGDQALVRFSALLEQHGATAGVLASRIGGEEFALLFQGDKVQSAGKVLDAVLVALDRIEIKHPASPVSSHITLSAGLAVRGAGDQRAEDLFRRADRALYQAKAQGRKNWVRSGGHAERDESAPEPA